MNAQLERIQTAALLHDIGKFSSRTGQNPPFDKQEREHFNTYAHALWSAHFVERYLHDSAMADWVRSHHDYKSQTRESSIISLADWLSSGEREEDEDADRDRPETAPLVNVLSRLTRCGNGSKTDTSEDKAPRSFFPLIAHGVFEDGFMPREKVVSSAQEYGALWSEFEKTLERIDTRKTPHATWLALMRRFCSRIPAATPTRVKGYVPDISLYEHSRITAALAGCFAADNMTQEKISEIRTALSSGHTRHDILKKEICRLVCGNLSGIQEFLYTGPRKGAAKTLRARSFTLQLLAETCAAWLSEQAGLSSCSIVYNGGGRFYVLCSLNAPLEQIERELESRLHACPMFDGVLSVFLGWTDLAPADFLGGAFSEKWREAGAAANEKRTRRYSQLAAQDYDSVFGSSLRADRIASWESVEPAEDEQGVPDQDKCYLDLGRKLPNAKWLVKCRASNAPDGINKIFARFGIEYELCTALDEAGDHGEWLELVQLGGLDAAGLSRLPSRTALSYRSTATHWPSVERSGAPATFEEIAARSTGAKKLGVLHARPRTTEAAAAASPESSCGRYGLARGDSRAFWIRVPDEVEVLTWTAYREEVS